MIRKLFALLALYLSTYSVIPLAHATEFEVVVCDTCLYDYQFEIVAKTRIDQTVVVMNTVRPAMRAYNVSTELADPDDWGVNAIPVPLPDEALDALTVYIVLKNGFENSQGTLSNAINEPYTSEYRVQNDAQIGFKDKPLSFQPTANGCGTESGPNAWSYPFIPNFPFRSACNSHDSCYGEGESKSLCDAAFLNDMNFIAGVWGHAMVDERFSHIFEKLLELQAVIYYSAVAGDSGMSAFCSVPLNSSAPECINETIEGGGADALTFINELSIGYNNANYVCQLWRFPDGLGGHYFLKRNCRVAY